MSNIVYSAPDDGLSIGTYTADYDHPSLPRTRVQIEVPGQLPMTLTLPQWAALCRGVRYLAGTPDITRRRPL